MKVECSVCLRRFERQQPNCLGVRTVAPFRIRMIFGQAPPSSGQEFVLVVEAISFIVHVAINLLPFMMLYRGRLMAAQNSSSGARQALIVAGLGSIRRDLQFLTDARPRFARHTVMINLKSAHVQEGAQLFDQHLVLNAVL
jgi:hypothetical protein